MAWIIGFWVPHDPGDLEPDPTAWLALYNNRSQMHSFALGWRHQSNCQRRATGVCPLIMGEQVTVINDPSASVTSDEDDRQADEREEDD